MGKAIAVFCDGTWNNSDARKPTNVVKLAQMLAPTDAQGRVQQVIYVPGVGTGRGSTALARGLDRAAGGMFGLGLNLNLEEAYRALVFAHEPGDRIFLFGFSRGAYMARSLAGLLYASGLPPRRLVADVRKALARYRSPLDSTKPNHPRSHLFRLAFSPEVTTSPQERAWREAEGYPPGVPLRIEYVGVWDTVGAMGVPAHYRLLAGLLNGAHRFHDDRLSQVVAAARHAVAVDERRRTFQPTLWDNLDTLNAAATGADRPYRQHWFPGDHGSVGGGGDVVELSDRALRWVAEGAQAQGLAFLPGALPPADDRPRPDAALRNHKAEPSLPARLLSFNATDRAGPKDFATLAPETVHRWCHNPDYRPRTLYRVSKALTEACRSV